MWFRKKLTELNPIEFYQVLKLRIDTFVVEQERIYHELDAKDLEAVHVFHTNEGGEIDAYARVFVEGEHLVFGRVVTAKSSRGKGLGGQLIREILSFCAEKWPGKEIKIEAQEQVVELYEKYGFEAVGQPFLFESTPHLTMVYKAD
ncbi:MULTISPECIES: GNAT family N-acetyltransferase [Streptococcus]|jgi:acetyltransferase|uniref:GNAT family N-acetyltransferase n=1 Tax=Streptococcus TaxID=1301 RepID=UPI00077994FA|nr:MULTISPECIES: GNAT family N-acetyltransferase [Streptococcus]MBZ2132042.1 GNAT family N-acetyltransferase [Streptococcus gordonii]MCY7133938.1 GNAT family N-acetyltransferase [Streptococcus gordonii]MCY7137077.1 GNAT family N-acetyltransferase [Streptococcus gordonii]OFL24366.1 GNAT family acetyltransferase [Streptococcus sp. HMSC062B01]